MTEVFVVFNYDEAAAATTDHEKARQWCAENEDLVLYALTLEKPPYEEES